MQIKNRTNMIRGVHPIALFAGGLLAFIFMVIIGEFFLRFIPGKHIGDNLTSILVTAMTFSASGFITAIIAKPNGLLNSVLLGAFFFLLTVSSYYSPDNSDPLSALLQAGIVKLVFCTVGGLIGSRYWTSRQQKKTLHNKSINSDAE